MISDLWTFLVTWNALVYILSENFVDSYVSGFIYAINSFNSRLENKFSLHNQKKKKSQKSKLLPIDKFEVYMFVFAPSIFGSANLFSEQKKRVIDSIGIFLDRWW